MEKDVWGKTVNIVTQSNLQSSHSRSKIWSIHFPNNKGCCNHLLWPIKKIPCTKQSITMYVPYLVFLVTILWECFPYQGQIEIHHSSFSFSFSAYPGDQNAVCSKIYSQISLLDQMHNYLETNKQTILSWNSHSVYKTTGNKRCCGAYEGVHGHHVDDTPCFIKYDEQTHNKNINI